jgi:hypothetical protein
VPPQLGHGNHSLIQFPLPDGAFLVDQHIAPLSFVLVPRQFRATGEPFGMLAPFCHGFKEAKPGFVQLDEDLIAHLARKGLLGFMLLDQMKDCRVVETRPPGR